jgi:WD40 repeat protein
MPMATRTFRVFVSSTFEDLKAERNALQEKVFPELVKLCAEKGARFQAIDLRWGVREEAGLDHRTMEICLAEITRCQKTGIKPNFIVLLGDRYGWKPLPSRIKKDEFEALLAHITTDERSLLVFEEGRPAANNGWYRLDWNAVPPEYLLMPRDGQYKERIHWEPVETRIGEVLRKAARAAGFGKEALVKYEASATHQEILSGLGEKREDREHVFAFLRNPNGPKDTELGSLIETLRRSIPESNVFPFSEGALEALCRQVTESLRAVIESEVSRFQAQSALEQEKEAHKAFAQDRSKNFVGRAIVRAAIKDYLGSDDARPLVVHGPSGSGKSAIIAKASEDHEGIRRFIGATPEASNGLTLLRSLCEEIGERYGQAGTLPATFNDLVVLFQDRLRLATADRRLVLYVDALDQLGPQDPAAAMNWLPPELPPHCRVVSSAVDLPAAFASAKLLSVEPFSVKDADETLELWLRSTKRTLQKVQREKLLWSFRQDGLPFYLKLAFEEARLWRSFDPTDRCALGDGLPGIIDRLFARLSEPGNHGQVLVSHTLGYVAAARYGLTEDEMLNVLAANDAVWVDFERTKKHDPPQSMLSEVRKEQRQLPVIVWARLYLDLEPYLTERAAPGGTTISFYHRQLAERVISDRSRHAELARYFAWQSNWRGPEQANERKITELVRQQISAELLDDAVATLTELDFLSAKCAAELVFDLQDDYRETIAALPEANAELQEELQRQANVARWTEDFVEYAKQWSTWRDRRTQSGLLARLIRHPLEPRLRQIIRSIDPFTDEHMAEESKRIMGSPTRLDLLKAFSGFVEQEAHALLELGKRHGFLVQHAFNWAPASPFHSRVLAQLASLTEPQVFRVWPPGVLYNAVPALLRTLELEAFSVSNVIATMDGRRAVSGSQDNTLRIWDLETGQCLRTMKGHGSGYQCMGMTRPSMTPDGRRVVSGHVDHALRLWDLETGQCLRTMKGHADDIRSVSMTPDGRRAVSGSVDRTVRLWDLETGQCLRTMKGHADDIRSVSITPDGRRALSASWDTTLRLWDLESGACLLALNHTSERWRRVQVNCVSVTPDCRLAVSGSVDLLRVWDLKSGACLRTLEGHADQVNCVSVTPDGRQAVSGSNDRTVRVWDLDTGKCLRTLEGHISDVYRTSVNPDGRRATSWSLDKTLRVWNIGTGQCLGKPEGHTSSVNGLSVTPDGRRAVSGSSDEPPLRLWDLETGLCLRTLAWVHRVFPYGMSVTPDGRRAVSGSSVDVLYVWDLESGECLRTINGHGGTVKCLSVTPDGLRVVSGSECVSVTPDGRRVVSRSDDTALRIWDLESGQCLRKLEQEPGPAWSVAVTSDGREVVSGGSHRGLRVWDLDTGKCLRTLVGHTESAWSVSLTPDGRRAVSGSGDRTLRLWDLESGACLRTLEGHTASVKCVSVTPDGRQAVSGSLDKTLRVWDLETGQCVVVVRLNARCITVDARCPNRIVAGTSTGEVLFYNVRGLNTNPS